MTEPSDILDDVDLGLDPEVERPEPTGVARVDTVIDALADLDPDALEDQVAVFERAQTELRRALDDPGAV
ncbi:hypothetical protein ABFT23_10975 [Nocardioides sp. C4-1]|uniref:hypothetical protein n=1 Tax=Nocardioides sp. C4-1 TaxID=3151851 RepID=UPI0032638D6A